MMYNNNTLTRTILMPNAFLFYMYFAHNNLVLLLTTFYFPINAVFLQGSIVTLHK